MIPYDATRAFVAAELPSLLEWSRFHGVNVVWEPDPLLLRVALRQRATGELFYLIADLQGYRVVPPAWDFGDREWKNIGAKSNYPAAARLPFGGSSVFHSKPVICAPFNRLAWKENGGPHHDWGTPDQWLAVDAKLVRAPTLGDMVSIIARDLSYSPGRMK